MLNSNNASYATSLNDLYADIFVNLRNFLLFLLVVRNLSRYRNLSSFSFKANTVATFYIFIKLCRTTV